MIKKTDFRYVAMLCVLLISGILGYFISHKGLYGNDTFFCTSHFRIHEGRDMLDLSVNYNLEQGIGFATMEGTYFKNGIKTSDISLEKEFLYTQNDGAFVFTQKKDGVLEWHNSDMAVLRKFVPDFYFSNTVGAHHVRIKTIRPGVWIVVTTPTPYMVCSEY